MNEKRLIVVFTLLVLCSTFFYAFSSALTGAVSVQGIATLGITSSPVLNGPTNFSCAVVNNHSINLSWNSIPLATNYTVYYSTNISAIMTLNISNPLPPDVTAVTDINDTYYLDVTPADQKRYYSVAAVNANNQSLTQDQEIGKFTYYYTTPNSTVYGPLASQRIAVYLNYSTDAETFMQNIPHSYNPSLSRLEKSNATGEYYVTHVAGLNDGNNFTLFPGIGYLLTVDVDFNQTICAKIKETPYVLYYDVPVSDVYGPLASNFRGIYDFKTQYTAESFLQETNLSLNPAISRMDKADLYGEYFTTHVGGLQDGHIYALYPGTGYLITIDNYFNHTLCTNCFE